jgi:hypothetical protein
MSRACLTGVELCLLLAAYIVADFAHDGRLNGSLPGAIIRLMTSSAVGSR